MFYKTFNNKKISFADFVDYSLYGPQGYYKNTKNISKNGDFLTSPSISKFYSYAIASHLIDKCSFNNKMYLVEAGSNDGSCMKHVIDYLENNISKKQFSSLSFITIEKNVNQHKNIAFNLQKYKDRLLILEDISSVNDTFENAIFFSNELFDAFPFHRCVFKNNNLHQINLEVKKDTINEVVELADNDLLELIEKYKLQFINNIFFESPIQHLEKYFNDLSNIFLNLYILINDYGDKSIHYHTSPDPYGTARVFYKHEVSRNFYENISRQDITYDVNFSLLKLVAEKFGFKESYYSSQTNFFLNNKFILNQISDINLKNIKKLIDPHQMGERFKFISFLKKKKSDI